MKMNRGIAVFAIGILLVLASSVQAQVDAYSIEVAVTDRSAAQQQSAYLIGMRSVLLANSGDKTLLNRNDVREGLRSAETFVDSFSYRAPSPGTVISSSTAMTDEVRQTAQATQLMLVRFNQQRIDALIANRDKVAATPADTVDGVNPFLDVRSALVWMLVDDGGVETLVGAAAARNVMERAREIAGGSGVSLSFPAADEPDQQALEVDDIRTANVERISQASARYRQELVLAAHLTRTRTGAWQGVWSKVASGQSQSTSTTSRSLDDAIKAGLDWLRPGTAGEAAAQQTYEYGGLNRSNSEALVWVSPLRSTKSYADVLSFLDGIEAVETVYPKEVLNNGMVFAVLPRNAVNAVSTAAGLAGWLQQTVSPAAAGGSGFAGNFSLSLEYLR